MSSPTAAPTEALTVDEVLREWALFSVLVILALSMKFFTGLLFSFLANLKFRGRRLQWLSRLSFWLMVPTTKLLGLLFVYLAVFVALAGQWTSVPGLGPVNEVLFVLWTVAIALIGMWFAYRLYLFLLELLTALLRKSPVPRFSHPVLIEFATIALGVLLIIEEFLLVSIPFGEQGRKVLGSLFTTTNWLTMLLVIGLTPALRDIVAGITLFSDSYFQPRELLKVLGVCKVGHIIEFRLRTALVRCLDGTLIFVPNSKFLRYPTVYYSRAPSFALEVTVPLLRPSAAHLVRDLLVDLQIELDRTVRAAAGALPPALHAQALARPAAQPDAHLTKAMAQARAHELEPPQQALRAHDARHWSARVSDPAEAKVFLGDVGTIVLTVPFWDTGAFAAVKRLQSDVLLFITDVLERHAAELRGPASVLYRHLDSMPGHSD